MVSFRRKKGAGSPRTSREVIGDVSVPSVTRAGFAILAILCGVLAIVFLQHIIVLLLLGLLLSTVMDPAVQWLRRRHIHTSLAVLLIYTVAVAIVVSLVLAFIPIIAEQLGSIIVLGRAEVTRLLTERTVSLPFLNPEVNVRLTLLLRDTLHNLSLEGGQGMRQLHGYLATMAAGSIQFLGSLAGAALGFIWNAFLVLLFAFFIQMERGHAYRWVRKFCPEEWRPYMDERADMIGRKMGQWIRGQLLLCLCIGVITFIVLLILGVPYALTLALLAAFTEFIPYIGPILGAVPAVMIALAQGGLVWGITVIVAYYLIQFLENNVFVPVIMKHSVELSAVAIMFAMVIGISFPDIIHPILGILISVPLAGISDIFLKDLRDWQRKKAVGHGIVR